MRSKKSTHKKLAGLLLRQLEVYEHIRKMNVTHLFRLLNFGVPPHEEWVVSYEPAQVYRTFRGHLYRQQDVGWNRVGSLQEDTYLARHPEVGLASYHRGHSLLLHLFPLQNLRRVLKISPEYPWFKP